MLRDSALFAFFAGPKANGLGDFLFRIEENSKTPYHTITLKNVIVVFFSFSPYEHVIL